MSQRSTKSNECLSHMSAMRCAQIIIMYFSYVFQPQKGVHFVAKWNCMWLNCSIRLTSFKTDEKHIFNENEYERQTSSIEDQRESVIRYVVARIIYQFTFHDVQLLHRNDFGNWNMDAKWEKMSAGNACFRKFTNYGNCFDTPTYDQQFKQKCSTWPHRKPYTTHRLISHYDIQLLNDCFSRQFLFAKHNLPKSWHLPCCSQCTRLVMDRQRRVCHYNASNGTETKKNRTKPKRLK